MKDLDEVVVGAGLAGLSVLHWGLGLWAKVLEVGRGRFLCDGPFGGVRLGRFDVSTGLRRLAAWDRF